MPRSSGRPLNRRPEHPKPAAQPALCPCGGKATRYGRCVRCLDDPLSNLILQAHGVYLPTRAERRASLSPKRWPV